MKSFLSLSVTILLTLSLNAQVGIGNTNPQGALDITSTTDGLLIPRVALTSTTVIPPAFVTPTASEMVYNTATAGDVTPGYYYLSSATGPWVRFGASEGWLITGNNNIVDGTNFLGTVAGTDVDIAFRRNGLAAGKLSINSASFGVGALNNGASSNSAAFGTNALNVSTGQQNVAIGGSALANNGSGANNVAIGFQALLANTNSPNNTAIGHRAMASLNGSAWSNNVAIGWGAMSDVTTTVTNSTFVGVQAGRNSRGTGSVGIGRQALGSNNGGPSTGIYNTAVGYGTLAFNTSGFHNTVIGAEASAFSTSGRENTSVGYRSGYGLTAGYQNSFLGYGAGNNVTSGFNNIAIGYNSLVPSATASNQLSIGNWIYGTDGNIGIGIAAPTGALDITSTNNGLLIPRIALAATTTVTVATPTASELVYNTATTGDVTPGYYYLSTATGPWVPLGGAAPAATGWLTTGNNDIVDGTSFLGTVTGTNVDVAFRRNGIAAGKIGTSNTSYGLGALINATPGIQNTAFGIDALSNNTGAANTAVGFQASAANGGAERSVAFGFQAMANNISNDNTAVGFQALSALNASGSTSNVAIGFQAMQSSNGTVPNPLVGNTFIGRQAGLNSSGDNNVGVGMSALGRAISTGNNNIAIGVSALEDNTSGIQNTIIGNFSVDRTGAGSNNTVIGYGAGSVGSTTAIGSNNILIGSGAQVSAANASNEIVIGAGTASAVNAYVNAPAWSYSSDRKLKSDIKDSQLGLDFIKTIRPVSYYRKNDKKQRTEFGFIAQELETALNTAGLTNTGILSKTANGMFAVRYNEFLPMTVKAVQEQQELIEQLQKQNAELIKMNAAILKRLEALEKNN